MKLHTWLSRPLNVFFRTPLLFVPALCIIIYTFLLESASKRIVPGFTTAAHLYLWLGITGIISLAVFSYALAGLIGISFAALKRQPAFPAAMHSLRTHVPRIAGILLISVLAISLVRVIAHYGTGALGTALSLSVPAAQTLFYLIYSAGLLAFLIFLTFSSFFAVRDSLSLISSIRASTRFVKQHYLETLSLLVVSFILYEGLYSVLPIAADIIYTLLVTPALILLLAHLMNHDI
ncbi:hypothetical protein HYZ97_02885 [Candidatus Pacearchaeota archaeon]|nr:hypothetical protein [Candidatus Pacearchaeota archaeon]